MAAQLTARTVKYLTRESDARALSIRLPASSYGYRGDAATDVWNATESSSPMPENLAGRIASIRGAATISRKKQFDTLSSDYLEATQKTLAASSPAALHFGSRVGC